MLRDPAYTLGGVFALGFIGGPLLSLYLIGTRCRFQKYSSPKFDHNLSKVLCSDFCFADVS